jgi:putative endonuclease
MSHTYCVYMLASRSRNLYTGVTNNLERRLFEHRQSLVPGFTERYQIFRLVHFEQFGDIRDAIAREKEIKGWRREKRFGLLNATIRRGWILRNGFHRVKTPVRRRHREREKQIPHARSPKAGDRVRDDNSVSGGNVEVKTVAAIGTRLRWRGGAGTGAV